MSLLGAPNFWLKNESTQNFGDFLSEFFYHNLFLPIRVPCDEVRIVGSCIHDHFVEADLNGRAGTVVFWGCGLREASGIGDGALQASRILSVRGPLSRSILKLGDEVPIGDPGLLMPALYSPKSDAALSGDTLLVPHFHDQRSDVELKALSGCDVILRPNIENDIRAINDFVDRITSADFVLCGSLHSAIVAVAYGKSFGFWDSGNTDLPFKWEDFAASVSIPCHFLRTVAEAKEFYVNSIRDNVKIPILWPMLMTSPYAVRPEVMAKVIELDYRRHGDLAFLKQLPKATLQEIAGNLQHEIESTQSLVGEFVGQITSLNQAVAERDEQIASLEQAVTERNKEISAIFQSTSWKITVPLRIIKRSIFWGTQMQREVIRRTVRGIYHRLPVSPYCKSRFRDWIFSRFGILISFTDTYQRWFEYKGLTTNQSDFLDQSKLISSVPIASQFPLKFDEPIDPIVSIVIPVYNNWYFTEACLRSIRNNSGSDIPYEIIIADDCSTDETRSRLTEIPGLRVIENEKNLGFLRNCNNAASHARGRYVVLLNNDTEVSKDWLKFMLDVFNNFDRVGVVAGKLIYPDGSVQEAGGIMMRNGWGHPYGRFDDPKKYEFNYVKEIDCAIGACLMVDRYLFEQIGGFDERYIPAHYEEFDFEFAVKAQGYRVMYQPAAEITHHESVSGGREFRNRQSMINHEKFAKKWRKKLSKCPESEVELYLARDSASDRKKILIIEDMVPHYDKHAGAVTIFQYMRLLTELGFKVVFLPDNLRSIQPYTIDMQQLGIEVIYGDFDFKDWFSTNGAIFDYCWLCRPDVSRKYVDIIRKKSSARILYYTHDLHYVRELRRYELTGNERHLQESKRLKAIELEIFNRVDVVLSPSGEEGMMIRELCPKASVLNIPAYIYEAPIHPYGLDVSEFNNRKDLLFLGGYGHIPNVDAVLWFVKEVLPLVNARLPDIIFNIAGSNVPDELMKLAGPNVRVRGFISDLEELFDEIRVFVAPLRFGAGVKGKIVTSLYHGVPVVTTSIGNEGLNLANGDQVLVGDSVRELADQICKLYQDPDLWVRLSVRSSNFIREQFSIESARNSILRALGVAAERCYVCGMNVFFSPAKDIPNLREAHICPDCWTLKRTNDLAYVLIQAHGGNKRDSLHSLVHVFSKLRIYEIGFVGPIHDLLSKIPGFTCSEYFDDVKIGEISTLGVRCEDVEKLTFPDMSFDLIISQDVFEHVPNPIQGFREIFRALKNGGIHAFTIPFSKSLSESFQRARIDEGIVSFLAEPVYHGDPIREEGALVFTDFGRDLVNSLTEIGFQVELHEFVLPEYQGGSNTVFVARKLTTQAKEVML